MASKLHTRVKELLQNILGTRIQEEINVKKLFPEYYTGNQHFDLVIPSYKLIIECHGAQHLYLQTFGEKDTIKSIEKLSSQKHRDRQKEEIVWQSGWGYISIFYNELPKSDQKASAIIKQKILDTLERMN